LEANLTIFIQAIHLVETSLLQFLVRWNEEPPVLVARAAKRSTMHWGLHTEFYFLTGWRLQVQDQGVGKVALF
jgi:hypothetical protein